MGRIMDFKCTYDNASGFGEWAAKDYGIQFPKAYQECDEMVKLALAVKEHDGTYFCQLPFCHTLEAEMLGGKIRLGDGVTGPRASGYICKSLEEVLELPEIDVEGAQAERFRETLWACRKLKEMREPVVFLVSGPMTVLNGLVDSEVLFRAILKKPELVLQVFQKLGDEIWKVMKRAEEAGVDVISYADPSGGVNLVGPKAAERISRGFTAEFLKRVDRELEQDTVVMLCPKTALSLTGLELACWKDRELPRVMRYCEAVDSLHGVIRFSGQDCLNHVGNRLQNRIFKELVFET